MHNTDEDAKKKGRRNVTDKNVWQFLITSWTRNLEANMCQLGKEEGKKIQ